MDTQKLYAILDPSTGHVKIGRSIDPEQRLKAIEHAEKRTGLRILIIQETPSAFDSEVVLHGRFAEHRVIGEWFNLTDEMVAELQAHFEEMKVFGNSQNVYQNRKINDTYISDFAAPAVIEEMEKQSLTRYQLAKDIGVEAPNISRLLNGRSGKIPESWERIFERLGLKLVVIKDD